MNRKSDFPINLHIKNLRTATPPSICTSNIDQRGCHVALFNIYTINWNGKRYMDMFETTQKICLWKASSGTRPTISEHWTDDKVIMI